MNSIASFDIGEMELLIDLDAILGRAVNALDWNSITTADLTRLAHQHGCVTPDRVGSLVVSLLLIDFVGKFVLNRGIR